MRMKKFTFLLAGILISTMSMLAQNLIENPGFESWTTGQPDIWTTGGTAIVLSQNTANTQEGSSSCQVVFTSQDNQDLKSNSFSVTPGDPIAVSFYVYDNDAAGRARLSILYEGGSNYYDSNYSVDMDSWQLLSYEGVIPDGVTQATFQIRFYDVAPWDGDCTILVDNCSFVIDNVVKPEPTNFPTAFAASPNGLSAVITWADATGEQLPQKYLVLASTSSSFTAPVDGSTVADDADLSNGSAALNVSFGSQSASFSGVDAGATYYFTIYPYTNDGVNADYKTDGTAPTATVTMPNVSVINYEDFEDDTFGDWVAYNVSGDQVWETAAFGNPGICAKMSGYSGSAFENEDWLISPAINLDNYTGEEFSFETSMNYEGPALECYISTDYSSGDPNTATWQSISFTPSTGSWAWTPSGIINLSSYTGTAHLAFKFTSTSSISATWEVDNILITGTLSNGVSDQNDINFQVYPNPSSGVYQINNSQSSGFEISVYNILGEIVFSSKAENKSYTLDIQNLDNGMYFLQINSEQQIKTISLIKR